MSVEVTQVPGANGWRTSMVDGVRYVLWEPHVSYGPRKNTWAGEVFDKTGMTAREALRPEDAMVLFPLPVRLAFIAEIEKKKKEEAMGYDTGFDGPYPNCCCHHWKQGPLEGLSP